MSAPTPVSKRRGGRIGTLWLFFLAQYIMPAAGQVALRIRSKVTGIPVDEAAVAQGEEALSAVLPVVESQLANANGSSAPISVWSTAPTARCSM